MFIGSFYSIKGGSVDMTPLSLDEDLKASIALALSQYSRFKLLIEANHFAVIHIPKYKGQKNAGRLVIHYA